MNGYKKYLSFKTRFAILRLLRFVPDKTMLRLQYRIKLKRKLDLSHPRRYSEKLQWYKLNYRDNRMPICADKYTAREYVGSKGLGRILVDQYACWNDIDEIDLDALPERFVLKLTTGSNTNILCRDKSALDPAKIKEQFRSFLKQTKTSAGREWVYNAHRPKIIAEQLLVDKASPDGSVTDYKFLCFDGKPKYAVMDIDRFTDHRRNIYDTEWNDLHIETDCPCSEQEFPKPAQLDQMLEIAAILSEGFPAVRVDLYNIGDAVYFGEMTFFPWSGYVQFTPDSFDYVLGSEFVLPEKQ